MFLSTLVAVALSQTCPAPEAGSTVAIVPDAGALVGTTRMPLVRWSIVCPPRPAGCTNAAELGLADIRTEYAADATLRPLLASGTGYPTPTAVGEGPLPGYQQTLTGGNVAVSVLANCFSNGGSLRVRSAPVVVAAQFTTGLDDRLARVLDASGSVTNLLDADQLPVGQAVHLGAPFSVTPAPTEPVTIRIQGAGIDFTRSYTLPLAELGRADRVSANLYGRDFSAMVTPSAPGVIRFWVEFAGSRSAEKTFTAVASGASGGGGGSASGGGSGATGGGTSATGGGNTMNTGCSASGVMLPFLMLGLVLRRRATSGVTAGG